jgi:hypothetical protein
MCTFDVWVPTTKKMKEQCSIIVISLIEELVQRFPNQKFMNLTWIVYP